MKDLLKVSGVKKQNNNLWVIKEKEMSINILNYAFEGPYKTTNDLKDNSGVYAILGYNGQNYSMVDVGESGTVKNRVENHDRKNCWIRKYPSQNLRVAVYYTPYLQQAGRMSIEQEIRSKFSDLCGDN